jgi:hypothetical protein
MQATPVTQGLVSTFGPAPLAPELLKLVGGGVAVPTSTPTPQAPKATW